MNMNMLHLRRLLPIMILAVFSASCTSPSRKTDANEGRLAGAAANGNMARVIELLDSGADINENAPHWGTALDAAALEGHTEIVRLLLTRGADSNVGCPLGAATVRHNVEIINILLSQGAKVNAPSPEYRSCALATAAYYGYADIIELFIKRGADVNGSPGGSSPLSSAASRGHVAAMGVLLANGANVNAQNEDGYTPLHSAAWSNKVDAVSYLLDHGADMHRRNCQGKTPMDLAQERGHHLIVGLLRDKEKSRW